MDSSYDSAVGMALVTLLVMWVLIIAISVASLVGMWKMFVKAGKEGWKSIIPVYNMIVMLQITGMPEWYVILYFLPFVNIYVTVKVAIELSKVFGKTTAFGLVLLFFPPVGYMILGLGSALYVGNGDTVKVTYETIITEESTKKQ